MANLINTAISGLKLSQLALSITGHNIVNANTEGYTRQSVSSATSGAQATGAGYVGGGVVVTDIFRNTQQFIVDQVSRDISVLANFDAYLSNITEMDNLLANPSSSLANGMNQFFEALNEAANDPASLLGRQLLMTQTSLLAQNFKTMDARLQEQSRSINAQFDTLAVNATAIAKDIAALNNAIGDTVSTEGRGYPNDLLDQRDQLVRDLSKIIDVTVVTHGDQTIDVFVAEGQGLVVGNTSNVLASVPGTQETARRELAFQTGPISRIVTAQVSGGELGGLVRYRLDALEPAMNSLGRVALAVSDGLNQQQKLGIDLEGNLGQSIFEDINSPTAMLNRVRADSRNKLPNDRELTVHIDDVSKLKASDYILKFEGPGTQFSVIREADNKLVGEGVVTEKLPLTITMDGFTVTLKKGSFQAGDNFRLQPTRTAVKDMEVVMTRPETFAFASPLRTQSGAGNSGGAFILPGTVTDITTASFSARPGELSPPVLIRFTSPTTYDVLDNSDPAYPVPMKPPLNNQRFSPGAVNQIFPSDPGGTTVSATGPSTSRLNVGDLRNGYQDEVLRFNTLNPQTGYAAEQRLAISQNMSAFQIAEQLNGLVGVRATAYTQLQLSDFVTDNIGAPLTLSLNGVDLTDPTYIPQGQLLPQAIPDPLTVDFLRDRINTNVDLQNLGISASSDGVRLTIRSVTGGDLSVSVGGNAGDSIAVRDGDLRSVEGRKDLRFGTTIPVGTRFDLDLGFGLQRIDLTPGALAASEIAESVQADIDAVIGAGQVVVSLEGNAVVLRSVGDRRALAVSNTTGGDPLGLSPVRITGPDQGAVPSVLATGGSADAAYNFAAQSSTFLVVVDGAYADAITLNQNYVSGNANTIVAAMQAQIDASVHLNGRVTAGLTSDGKLSLTTTSTGEFSSINVAADANALGLLASGTVRGANTSGSNGSVTGNISLESGFNFDSGGPHSFRLTVDGNPPVDVVLTGNSAVPAVFTATEDISGGVNLLGGPHSIDIAVNGAAAITVNLAGVDTTLAASPDSLVPPGILRHIQTRLNAALGAGVVTASLDDDNALVLTSNAKGDSAQLTLSNATGAVATSVISAGGTVNGTETGAAGALDLIRTAINDALDAQGIAPIRVGMNERGFLTLDSVTYGANSRIAVANVSGTYGALFPRDSRGVAARSEFAVGGTLDVQLASHMSMTSNLSNGLFGSDPTAISNFTGYQISINSGQGEAGAPHAGDTFTVNYNTDGTADNRNGAAMVQLNNALTLSDGNLTYQGAYGQLVESMAILTSQARLSQSASETLLRQSMESLQGVAGVNLDEEAALLIKFEQHYNASARLITMAKEMFDTILNIG
jgi:flagellar hook-associated protein 1 FlgK